MMKAIKLIIVLGFIFCLMKSSHAQDIDTSKLPDYTPYEGIWSGSNGNDSLIIVFKIYNEYFKPLNIHVDKLKGRQKYFENKSEFINQKPFSDDHILFSSGINEFKDGTKYLRFLYTDPITSVSGDAFMIFEHDSETVITWQLKNREGLYPVSAKIKAPNRKFSIPREMILRKIE